MRIAYLPLIGSFGAMEGTSTAPLTIPDYGPLVRVEEYNALRGLPTLPIQPREVHLSFFINELERVVRNAISTAPDMSPEDLVMIANERFPERPNMLFSYEELAADIALVTEAASDNPWNIFVGQDIFKLCKMFWDVHSHVAHLVIEALLAVPYSSTHEAQSVSDLIGFTEFAERYSEWIILNFTADFDRIQFLLGADFDVHSGPFVEEIDEQELEEIRTGAAQILDASQSDDILVFIGNAASYYYFALENSERTSFLVPFDGSHHSYPSEMEHFDKYERVFLDPIREQAQGSGKSVLVIDVTNTCENVEKLSNLLKFRRCDGCRIEIIQILTKASTEAATDYEAPNTIPVRALIYSINGSSSSFFGGSHPRLVPFFSCMFWDASSENMLSFYISRGAALSEITKIRDYVASKGLDWPHADSPMVEDLAAYLEFMDVDGDAPPALPLYYWTEAVAETLRYYADKDPIEEVEVVELESKPIESMAQLAFRLHKLESTIYRYFNRGRKGNDVESESSSDCDEGESVSSEEVYELNSAGSTSSSENDDRSQASIQRRQSRAHAVQVWKELGFDILHRSEDSSRSSMSDPDFGGSQLGDWAFELIDLARQNDYVRNAVMPALAPFAQRFSAVKTMIYIAFGEEISPTPNPHF